jgi:hypothetical protein
MIIMIACAGGHDLKLLNRRTGWDLDDVTGIQFPAAH